MITLYNFFVCDTTTQVLDIESPINIYNLLQRLQVCRKFKDGEWFLNVGDGSLISVLALGTIQLVFESKVVMLDDCHYCPSFLMNVISVGVLAKVGFNFLRKDNFYDIIMNGTIIIHGQLKHSLYLLSQFVSIIDMSNKCPKIDNVSDAYL